MPVRCLDSSFAVEVAFLEATTSGHSAAVEVLQFQGNKSQQPYLSYIQLWSQGFLSSVYTVDCLCSCLFVVLEV